MRGGDTEFVQGQTNAQYFARRISQLAWVQRLHFIGFLDCILSQHQGHGLTVGAIVLYRCGETRSRGRSRLE